MHSLRNRCIVTTALASALTATLTLTLAAAPAAADWPNFRGPEYDGIRHDANIQQQWDKPIPLVWDREIGSAFSSFAVVGDRLYTCGTKDKHQVLVCLNAATGAVIWENPFGPEYRDEHGDGARATPTVADGRVYILGAHGRLLCADAATGKDVWSKQFNHVPQWGYSGSVLVEGDLAISTAGNEQGTLVAFDRRTGEKRWQCGEDPPGYATPYPFTFNNHRYVVGFSGNSAIIADLATGALAWRQEWKTSWDVNAAAPIFHDGYLFLTSGYHTGCGLYKLSTSGDGLAAEEIWKSQVLLNKFQSCILHDGALYASDQKSLVCVDFLTGKEHWRIRRMPDASPENGTLVLADGALIMLTEDGHLLIAPASTAGFEPVTSAEILSGRCWTVPVLDAGRLYARNLERMACFKLSAGE
ncbi:MAG TPA: PQQ-binding-like beta-propeller repeat protein [Phycisphaerae bacterium]|nr:PQQ-like beta-propeller repeat protein [Phycisphaerales bacterium]HRX86790.1 PQQ-binding-like beta-propeller repeat protein [Phycisphaerae bacterium]